VVDAMIMQHFSGGTIAACATAFPLRARRIGCAARAHRPRGRHRRRSTVDTGGTRLATVANADVDPRVDPVEESSRPVAGRRAWPR
jgi:hypothetical protein